MDKRMEVHPPDCCRRPAGRVSAALQSVVTVEATDGHGSGCIVSEDGYIVTNYHVIADGADATLYTSRTAKSGPPAWFGTIRCTTLPC